MKQFAIPESRFPKTQATAPPTVGTGGGRRWGGGRLGLGGPRLDIKQQSFRLLFCGIRALLRQRFQGLNYQVFVRFAFEFDLHLFFFLSE